MPKFMVIGFDRYEAGKSSRAIVEAATAAQAAVQYLNDELKDDPNEVIPENALYKEEQFLPGGGYELEKGEEGLWGMDMEEESLLVIELP